MADDRVEVYWNVHKNIYSIRDKKTKKVILRKKFILLKDVKFKVYESGRQRVLADKRKNVHAWIEGTITDTQLNEVGVVVRYNPYTCDSFVEAKTGDKVKASNYAVCVIVKGKPKIFMYGKVDENE